MRQRVDREGLGAFLRARRERLQPEDVGLRRSARRRAAGLRREEVAELCDMSADYLARLERGAGPQPSEQIAMALARGLRLSLDERDHLLVLCGYPAPARGDGVGGVAGAERVTTALVRILDRLHGDPAQVMGPLGETLLQTPMAVALLGDQTGYTGRARSAAYRWFTDPGERDRYLPADHEHTGRVHVDVLRAAAARGGPRSAAAALVRLLRAESGEFAAIWDRQEVGLDWSGPKRFVHPQVGRLDLHCQTLLDPDRSQSLLVFTATPASPHAGTLRLLDVLGAQYFPAGTP